MSQSLAVLPDAGNGLVDRFGNGLVANDAAEFFQTPGALAVLPQSQWYIAQWGQPVAINPANYTTDNPATYDPVYGNALYSWTEPDTNSAIAIYQNTTAYGGGDVYDLTGGNTNAPPSSGATDEADIFLSSPQASNSNLSHPITLSLNAKITQSLIQFVTPALAAQYATSGTVFGTFDIGLTVNFDGADGLPSYSGFVQIVPWTSDSSALADYTNGPLDPGDASAQFITSTLLPGDPALSLLPADAGANPDTLSYHINPYVYNALVEAFVDFSQVQKAQLLNIANWTLGSVYIGPATNDAQTTSAGGGTVEVANEAVGIQVSNIDVTTNLRASDNPAAPAQGSEIDSNPQIAYVDNTIGASGTADSSVYSGPISGTQDKYIYTGADNVSLTATAGENWEFGGGSGLTELTAVSGDNIFVASTGSSYMVGGSGQDMFEIPDANETGIGTWDSIENFHVGDQISLAGLGGPGWIYSWYAGLSVGGNSGLTLLATSTVTPGLHELVTLVGLSMGDLSSLRIAPAASGNGGLIITRVDPQLQSYDLVSGVAAGLVSNATSNIVGINAEYIYTGTDSMALTAPAGTNWEFGGGSAFTDLTATSGNNIFIASTGGSNMQGGSGNDSFMIPDANLTGNAIWDNIANFHSGDKISLAGLAGPGWSYSWTDAYGTAGNPALTLQAGSTAIPGLTELVTLTGLSMKDLASLSVSHGSGSNAGALIVTHN